MAISFNDYVLELRKDTAKETFKVELMDNDENVIMDITDDVLDGSVKISLQNGSRRSAYLTLANINNKYTPSPKGLIWLQSKFRISSGLIVNSEEYLFSNGIFCLSQPEISNSTLGETTASFKLDDKWSYVDGSLKGTLSSDYIIPVGQNIGDAVKSIIRNEIGDVKPPIITQTTVASPYTLTMDRGDNYGDMLIKLAEMLSYECFYDKNGHFRFQPVQDDKTKESVWNFSTGETTYLGATRTFEFNEIKNSIYVYGDNINGDQALGSAKDTYIFSDTSIDRIGERVKVISDENIYNDSLAQQRAEYELKKAVIIQESTSSSCVPIYHLDCNDIITLEDKSISLERDRYIISEINLPLNGTAMSLTLWKTRPLE